MRTQQPSVLIVDGDRDLTGTLTADAGLRGLRLHVASSPGEAAQALAVAAFDAAVVDLGVGAEPAFEIIRRLRAHDAALEIVVTAGPALLASAIQSSHMAAFAIMQKPFEAGQLLATLDRALERRQMNRDNQRLVWELQTINDVAESIARSLVLSDVLVGALQRVARALSAAGGSIRLRSELTGAFEIEAFVGPPHLRKVWADLGIEDLRPSEQVIATGAAVILEDLLAFVPPGVVADPPVRSAVSVPLMAGKELVGTMSLGSSTPYRFTPADQRLLAIIAGQVSVAVENARLHTSIVRGKREWERTFDAISDPIAVFDGEGALLRGNTALAAHLGRPVTALRGTGCHEIGFCDCTRAGTPHAPGVRTEVMGPDGQIFNVTTFPVSGGIGDASQVLVAKNVTEEILSKRRLQQLSEELRQANSRSNEALERLRATQAQLVQAEKLSAIGQLVAGVAHELNNPLTSVIGYAQLLQDEVRGRLDVPEQFGNDLRRIAEESERAARIVRNLLAFARRQAASRQPHDIADLFNRVLMLRNYEMRLNNVELRTEFEPALPPVVADGGQLQQALLNLVLNAEQAMRGSSTRHLYVGARYDASAAALAVFVTDTGHGIDTADVSRVFDPFFTTRDVGEGTGLGLSICYGIVRDHGGEIRADSRPGAGATFSILLPAAIEPTAVAESILVAHADQGERDYLAAMLGGWGHTVVTAASAPDALARCRDGNLQVLVVDRAIIGADLPAWAAIRARGGQPPLILVSMSADDGDVDRFGREQAAAVLTPPYPLRAVRAAIRAVARECV